MVLAWILHRVFLASRGPQWAPLTHNAVRDQPGSKTFIDNMAAELGLDLKQIAI